VSDAVAINVEAMIIFDPFVIVSVEAKTMVTTCPLWPFGVIVVTVPPPVNLTTSCAVGSFIVAAAATDGIAGSL